MNCKNCGKQLDNDFTFCTECGVKLVEEEVTIDKEPAVIGNTTAAEVVEVKSNKKKSIGLRIAVCIVVLAMVFTAVFWKEITNTFSARDLASVLEKAHSYAVLT